MRGSNNGEAAGKVQVYDDDGEPFDFERGRFAWTELAVHRDATGKLAGYVIPDAGGAKWGYGFVTCRFMTEK